MAIRFHKKAKDKINRLNFSVNEKKRRYYKFMIIKYNKMLKCNDISRTKALCYLNNIQKKVQKMPNNKINNYCILTGRDKGVYRDFKLSRHQIKQNFKFLTGLRNSSF